VAQSETEKAFSSNPFKGKQTVKRLKNVGQFIAEATPIIGDAIAVNEIAEELKKDSPNWYLVGALGGASILGLIPGVGDAAANLVKKGTRRALDIASRIEIDVATVGMNAGNVRIKPKDIIKKDADGLDKIKKILDKEKNLDDNYYIVHGGMDFEGPLDLKYSGKGEKGLAGLAGDNPLYNYRPLGRGIYGYMFNPKSSISIKKAYEGTQNFAIKYGSSTSESWLGFKNPLYREAFKSANLPPETSEEMLKKLHKEVPMKRTVKNLGKVHLIKIPKNKLKRAINKTSHSIKVFDNEEQLAKNVNRNYEIGTIPGFQYDRKPQYLGDPFAFKGNNFGDAQLVSETFGFRIPENTKPKKHKDQRHEVSILDTSIAEVLGKVNIDKDVFDNLPVDKKKDFLKDRVTVDYDKEKLDASIKRRKLDYYAPKIEEGEARRNPVVSPSKGKQVNFSEFPYRLDDSNIDDIELARENIGRKTYFPKEIYKGETGRKIKPKFPEYNKGGTTMNKQMKMAFMQEGGEVERDPVSGNEVPIGSFPEEVRDDVPAMLSEGEYVVPADVLRFYGLKFFEDLRDKAKMALSKMEKDGRIGGEPMSPSIPDTPTIVNKGGAVKAQSGTMVGSAVTAEQMAAQAAQEASSMQEGGLSNIAPTYTANIQPPSEAAFQAAVSAPMGSSSNVGTSGMGRTALFVNQAGLTMQILVNEKGEPLYGAPPGYVSAASEEGKKRLGQQGVTTAPEAVKTETPKKKEKSGEDAFEKAKKSREAAKAAENRAIERLGIGDRADDYRALSLAQRVSLAGIEAKKMFDPKYVITEKERNKINEVLDNPADSPNMLDILKNPLLLITGGSKKPDTTTTSTPSSKPPEAERQDVGAFKSEKRDTFIEGAKEGGKKVIDKIDTRTPKGKKQAASAKEELDKIIAGLEEKPTLGFKEGALVTKPKRKPRAKRKSLGQKIK